MRVLVTGASGMLGRAVATELRDGGHEVTTMQRGPSGIAGVTDALGSITDEAAVERAVAGAEGIVHLAAKVSLSGAEHEFEAVNVTGTKHLLAHSKAAGATRFVMVSSPSVAHFGAAIHGASADEARPDLAHGSYARTKATAELLALAADAPEFAVVAVRPHLVWGPGDTQLIGRILERATRGTLPLLGRGAALIDSCYVDNAATGIAAALRRAPAAHGNSYVITNGEPRTVAELMEGICLAGGAPPPRLRVPAGVARAAGSIIEGVWRIRPGQDEPPMTRFLAEQLSTAHWFDQRRTRADLDWSPAVSLEEGLQRLADHTAATRSTAQAQRS
ncbi:MULTISPECIES: NAD-dependent epimerase/dehydratase family protein [unclassified Pseudoclavibacter]|uniref:NAD-dependent epimerase/dehydratase family protein n=1 Tax=unclassified Pseudoclavibacter TaxID=2615177 RepID=UPI0015CA2C68|nr:MULTISPECIES: NAD-dependent epimerase/dehydratase family protein [unclassified Pseudoclavibacter]MBS3178149.1 NAD-dependent epimerase/dehydratase family protein [Pseudoclavibacter sp. Marseille-Q4354]NYF13851.1 nucleoside-diphosphate-sugar epimerase [Pseudoclavibacter sp. JAI123]